MSRGKRSSYSVDIDKSSVMPLCCLHKWLIECFWKKMPVGYSSLWNSCYYFIVFGGGGGPSVIGSLTLKWCKGVFFLWISLVSLSLCTLYGIKGVSSQVLYWYTEPFFAKMSFSFTSCFLTGFLTLVLRSKTFAPDCWEILLYFDLVFFGACSLFQTYAVLNGQGGSLPFPSYRIMLPTMIAPASSFRSLPFSPILK